MSRRSRFTKVVGFENNRPARGGRWRTIWNLNFKKNDIQTTGALTENAGALTTLEGVQYHCRVNSASDQSWTITADTGLVVDFASSSSAIGRLDLKVPHFAQYPDGSWPRMRISASFSGLVVSHNSDYIAAGIGSMWRNNSAPYNPNVWLKYDPVNAATPTYAYIIQSIKGNLGGAGSGIESVTASNSDGDNDSGVLSVEDGGQGMFIGRGHSGDTNIITGSSSTDTFRGQITTQGYDGQSTLKRFYTAGASYDGPYVCLYVKNGNDGSQTVTWEQIIVEALV